MEYEYKEDDRTNPEYTGIWKIIEYFRCNVLRPGLRGTLFGLGHFITYGIIGGYITQRFLKNS